MRSGPADLGSFEGDLSFLSLVGRPVSVDSDEVLGCSACTSWMPCFYAAIIHDENGGHLYFDYTCIY